MTCVGWSDYKGVKCYENSDIRIICNLSEALIYHFAILNQRVKTAARACVTGRADLFDLHQNTILVAVIAELFQRLAMAGCFALFTERLT